MGKAKGFGFLTQAQEKGRDIIRVVRFLSGYTPQ
jgi:hypothetical protein